MARQPLQVDIVTSGILSWFYRWWAFPKMSIYSFNCIFCDVNPFLNALPQLYVILAFSFLCRYKQVCQEHTPIFFHFCLLSICNKNLFLWAQALADRKPSSNSWFPASLLHGLNHQKFDTLLYNLSSSSSSVQPPPPLSTTLLCLFPLPVLTLEWWCAVL